MNHKSLLAMLSLFVLLAACTSVEPTPTPLPAPVAALEVTAVPPTRTPAPTHTIVPSFTSTNTSTPTRIAPPEADEAEDSDSFFDLLTDILTPTPTQTPIPTSLPIPTQAPPVSPSIWTAIGTAMPVPQKVLSSENLTQMQELGRWGRGVVTKAIYSPDGQKLAVVTPLGVYFYDADTAELLNTIPRSTEDLSVALSPDWQRLAISFGSPSYDIQVWSVQDTSLLYTIDQNGDGFYGLNFSPDGQTLYASASGQPIAWRVSDGVEVDAAGYPGGTLSTDGQMTILSDEYDDLHIWRLENGRFVDTQQILPNGEEIQNTMAVAISPDGQLVAAGGWNLKVAVWRVEDGSLAYTVDIPQTANAQSVAVQRLAKPAQRTGPGNQTINDLGFSPDGQILAVATGIEDVVLVQAEDGRTLQRMENAGTSITFSPDGSRIAAWAHTFSQWNVQDGAFINSLTEHAGWVTDIAFTPDNQLLAIASLDNSIYLRQLLDGTLEQKLEGHSESVTSIDISQDGQTLVSGSVDRTVRVWNLDDNTSIGWIASNPWEIEEVGISFDGQVVASAPYDDVQRLWQASDGSLIRENRSIPPSCPITFSPVEFLFATCEHDNQVALWTLEDSRLLADPEGFYAGKLAFSGDGQYLASISTILGVWQVMSGEMLYAVDIGEEGGYPDLAFSPDGQLLAIISGRTVQLRDAMSGTPLYAVTGGYGFPTSVAFSPDGRILAIGSTDGTVRLLGIP